MKKLQVIRSHQYDAVKIFFSLPSSKIVAVKIWINNLLLHWFLSQQSNPPHSYGTPTVISPISPTISQVLSGHLCLLVLLPSPSLLSCVQKPNKNTEYLSSYRANHWPLNPLTFFCSSLSIPTPVLWNQTLYFSLRKLHHFASHCSMRAFTWCPEI